MRVRDLMTRSVVTTTPAMPVKDAAVVLAQAVPGVVHATVEHPTTQ